jgi:hypothetical protein
VSTKRLAEEENAVDRFVSRYQSAIAGVLSGFDRVVFQGILQRLIRTLGMYYFLTDSGIRLLDFVSYAKSTTARIKRLAEIEAKELGRPLRYLRSAAESKEALAREVLRQHPIGQGLICTFTTLEPCMTFEYKRSQDHSERGLKLYPGKCLHIYKYWLDPGLRLHEWTASDLVSFPDSDLHQRPGVAGETTRRERLDPLQALPELLPLDFRCSGCPTPHE